MCKVKLSDLKKQDENIGEPWRILKIKIKSATVKNEQTVALKKKKETKTNGVLKFPLFDLKIGQMVIPVLH